MQRKVTPTLKIQNFTFVVPNWHFGAYLINWVCFCEELDLKWHTFRKRTFQGSLIARQIYYPDPWNLVQNCPTATSFRTISHYLTFISYIVSRTLNVRKVYPYSPNPEFLAICCSLNFTTEAWKQQLNCIFMISSAAFVKLIDIYEHT